MKSEANALKPLILISAAATVWMVPISNVLPAVASVALELSTIDLTVAYVFVESSVVALGPVMASVTSLPFVSVPIIVIVTPESFALDVKANFEFHSVPALIPSNVTAPIATAAAAVLATNKSSAPTPVDK